uniref:Nodal homolog 4-B-like isoform X2 n=1 Tax=Petromyzon marinus TaxID=7757 RepID=A0AAJ7STV7_PETMA|nr:nodal homolog 4-B-like isoform X2 [Petromyzon marinus]
MVPHDQSIHIVSLAILLWCCIAAPSDAGEFEGLMSGVQMGLLANPSVRLKAMQNVGGTAPRHAHPHSPLRPPGYMLELYRKLRSDKRLGVTPAETALPRNSDTIRSIPAKGRQETPRGWRLNFDLSSVPGDETLQFAEIRFRPPPRAQDGSTGRGPACSVEIYHTSPSVFGEEPADQLVGSFTTPKFHCGGGGMAAAAAAAWRIVDFTEDLRKWLHHRHLTAILRRGLEAAGGGVDAVRSPPHPARARDNFTDAGARPHRRWMSRQGEEPATMVVFSRLDEAEGGRGSVSLLHHTVGHAPLFSDEWSAPARGASPLADEAPSGSRRHKRNGHGGGAANAAVHGRKDGLRGGHGGQRGRAVAGEPWCHRVDFYMSFEQIGWDAWVIQPKRFNAYRCEGPCPSPVELAEVLQARQGATAVLHSHAPELAEHPLPRGEHRTGHAPPRHGGGGVRVPLTAGGGGGASACGNLCPTEDVTEEVGSTVLCCSRLHRAPARVSVRSATLSSRSLPPGVFIFPFCFYSSTANPCPSRGWGGGLRC